VTERDAEEISVIAGSWSIGTAQDRDGLAALIQAAFGVQQTEFP
jgi:hypothetical protein